ATTSARLPNPSTAKRSARADPSESASGFSWQMAVMRSASRIALITASRVIGALLLELVEKSQHAVPRLDRVVVADDQLRDVADREPLPELPAQPRRRVGQRLHR